MRTVRRLCYVDGLSATVVCFTALCADLFAPVLAVAQAPTVRWAQERVEFHVRPGQNAVGRIEFSISEPTERLDIVVAPADGGQPLGGRMTTGIQSLTKVAAGVQHSITVQVSVAATDSGAYVGRLVLRAGDVDLGSLPVTVNASADASRPLCLTTTGVAVPPLNGAERPMPSPAPPISVPPGGCRIPIRTPEGLPIRTAEGRPPSSETALPAPTAAFAWHVSARASMPSTLLRIELHRRSDGGVERFHSSSDVARPAHALRVPARFDGVLDISRLDVLEENASVTVRMSDDDLARDPDREKPLLFDNLALSGHSFRTELDVDQDLSLLLLANDYQFRRDAVPSIKAEAYRVISDLVGRRLESQELERESESEPLVVFLGLGGLNRVVLIDCVSWPMPARSEPRPNVDCPRLAEPWQTTLERASHFWAVYIEDEQAAFDTSIDVEFPRESRAVDYDDFDPLNTVRGTFPDDPQPRRVRVGYRRFTIPSRQELVRVTFTRQGAAYGLKSWSREYRRYGRWSFQVAGGLALPAWFLRRHVLSLENVYGADPFNPVALELTDTRTRQPVFAMAFLRFSKLRAAAEQASGSGRLFVPDVAFGVGLPLVSDEHFFGQTLVIGGSWQIGLGDRIHLLAGALKTREIEGDPLIGRRFPVATSIAEVRDTDSRWLPVVGVSVDIARTP